MADWHVSERAIFDATGMYPGNIENVIYDPKARRIGLVIRGGALHVLVDFNVHTAGGKPIARLMLTDDARLEPDARAPDSDYEGEGFDYLAELYGDSAMSLRHDLSREGFERWRRAGGWSWVVRFEVIEVFQSVKNARTD